MDTTSTSVSKCCISFPASKFGSPCALLHLHGGVDVKFCQCLDVRCQLGPEAAMGPPRFETLCSSESQSCHVCSSYVWNDLFVSSMLGSPFGAAFGHRVAAELPPYRTRQCFIYQP